MGTNITIFRNPQFGDIRTAGTADNPLFCLKDVCSAIDITNQRNVTSRLDEEDVHVVDTPTKGGCQLMTYVSEGGLYDAIVRSDSPKAKPFRKWVTHEVLPSIRKTGGYIATSSKMTDAEIMAKAVLVAQSTIEQRNERIKQLETVNVEQKALIALMQKGNDYLYTILQSKGTLATTQISADYGMSAIAFNKKLNEMHIQHKVNGQWILYGEFMGKGYVHSDTISFFHKDGRPDTRLCTVWTQRGRLFLYDALKEIGILPLVEMAA